MQNLETDTSQAEVTQISVVQSNVVVASEESVSDYLELEEDALAFQNSVTNRMFAASFVQIFALSMTLCYSLAAIYRFFTFESVIYGFMNSTFLFASIFGAIFLTMIASIYQALTYHTQRVTELEELHISTGSARGAAVIGLAAAAMLISMAVCLLEGRAEWKDLVRENLDKSISIASNNKEIAMEVSLLQSYFECCGVAKNDADPSFSWLGSFRIPYVYAEGMRIRASVPWSCCERKTLKPCYNMRWARYWLEHTTPLQWMEEQEEYIYDEHKNRHWANYSAWQADGRSTVRTNRDCATVFYDKMESTIFIPLAAIFIVLAVLFIIGAVYTLLALYFLNRKVKVLLAKKISDMQLQSTK